MDPPRKQILPSPRMSRCRALLIVALAVVMGFAVVRLGLFGLVVAIPAMVLARALAGSLWAPIVYSRVAVSLWQLLSGQRAAEALQAALFALGGWLFGREQVDGVWRAIWSMPSGPENRGPGDGGADQV